MRAIQKQYQLKKHNTFGTSAVAEYYAEPHTPAELEEAVQFAEENKLEHYIIGEGSNLLFVKDYAGMIIHPCIDEISVTQDHDDFVMVRAGAGVNWDHFVHYCVENHWYGAENLSLIPGSVGAAPVQNIGAYGVEAKDLIVSVEAYDAKVKKHVKFTNEACKFGYRDSLFKQSEPGRYVVIYVVFKLQKKGALKLDYGNVREKFMQMNEQSLQGLRNTIIEIRESKLPDPEKTGNAGSFFKNPVITSEAFKNLKSQYPNIPGFISGEGNIKVPAAWLIEQAGWKGVKEGNTGTWPLQPLVIVNYGHASGREIYDFSIKINLAVSEKFGIELKPEVTVL